MDEPISTGLVVEITGNDSGFKAALAQTVRASEKAFSEIASVAERAQKRQRSAAMGAADAAVAASKRATQAHIAGAKKVESAYVKAFSGMSRAAAASRAASSAFAGIGGIAAGAGLVGGAAALGAGAREAVNGFIELDRAMREINSIAKVSQAELDRLKSSVQQVAIASGQDATRAARAMYDALSSGVPAANVAEFVGQASRLASAGVADLAETTKVLTATLNAYKLPATEAARISDVFFKTVELGVTTLPELSNQLGGVLATAAKVGVPIEEVAAAVANLTKNGVSTAEAVTGLNAALVATIKPSKEAKDLAARLGLDFSSAAIRAKGFAAFMADVADKTGMADESLATLFGDVQGLKAVFNLTGINAAEFGSILDEITHSAGATSEALSRMQGPALFQQQSVQAVRAAADTIGQILYDISGFSRDGRVALLQIQIVAQQTAAAIVAAFELAATPIRGYIELFKLVNTGRLAAIVETSPAKIRDAEQSIQRIQAAIRSGGGDRVQTQRRNELERQRTLLQTLRAEYDAAVAALSYTSIEGRTIFERIAEETANANAEILRLQRELSGVSEAASVGGVPMGGGGSPLAAEPGAATPFAVAAAQAREAQQASEEFYRSEADGRSAWAIQMEEAHRVRREQDRTTAEAQIENMRRAMEAEEYYADQRRALYEGIVQTVSGSMGMAVANILTGTETASEALKNMFRSVAATAIQTIIDIGVQSLITSAMKGSADAIAAHAGIPFVGLALGLGAAAAIVAAIQSTSSKAGSQRPNIPRVASYDVGGVVPGAMGAAMPAVIHGGEVILNPRQQSDLIMAMAGGGAGMSGGGGAVINFNGPVFGDRRTFADMLEDALDEVKRRGGRGATAIRQIASGERGLRNGRL